MPVLMIVVLLVACGRADAQVESPRVSVAAGAGIARQWYGEFDFTTTPVWQVSVRGHATPHLAIEGMFEQWTEQRGASHENVPLSGPNGPLGHVALIEERTDYRMRTIAFNALAHVRSGRVTFAAGGGAGVMAYDRTYGQQTSGCDTVAATAGACGASEHHFSSSSATAQGVASLDVDVVRRVSAFARYDLVMPLRDVAFGHGSVTAGVRVFVW